MYSTHKCFLKHLEFHILKPTKQFMNKVFLVCVHINIFKVSKTGVHVNKDTEYRKSIEEFLNFLNFN